MPTPEESREGKVALGLAIPVAKPTIEYGLHLFP